MENIYILKKSHFTQNWLFEIVVDIVDFEQSYCKKTIFIICYVEIFRINVTHSNIKLHTIYSITEGLSTIIVRESGWNRGCEVFWKTCGVQICEWDNEMFSRYSTTHMYVNTLTELNNSGPWKWFMHLNGATQISHRI